MIEIQNTQECFVQLWLRLEHTRLLLYKKGKRFCIRHVLQEWFGLRATEDFIWEVCTRMEVPDGEEPIYGYDQLPPPRLYPRRHRELLRAIVAVKLGIGIRRVCLHELDAAYSIAFPASTAVNVNKKRN